MNITPYLSENVLYDVLLYVFETKVNKQVRIKSNNKLFIIDYSLMLPNEQLMFVEFNGPTHYNDTKTIIRDYTLRDYCKDNNIKLVELPYFVQLFNHNFEKYFAYDIKNKVISTEQLSGFISKKIILPYDYCFMGIIRFLEDISLVDITTDEILKSIGNRTIEEKMMFSKFVKSLEYTHKEVYKRLSF